MGNFDEISDAQEELTKHLRSAGLELGRAREAHGRSMSALAELDCADKRDEPDDRPGDGPGDRPNDGPVDEPEPPKGWQPPMVGLSKVPALTKPVPVNQTWAGRRVRLTDATKDVVLRDTTVSKITGSGHWGNALFENVRVENEIGSLASVTTEDNKPKDIQPGETWQNSERATPYGGWMIFDGCTFAGHPDASDYPNHYQGYGGKMWVHPEAPFSLSVRNSKFEEVWEHGLYHEGAKHVEVLNCVFEPCGGTAIQITSRGGHGPVGDYEHGNPLNSPAGYGGWALIKDTEIRERYFEFRDASDISFAGFLGPGVVSNVACIDSISGAAHYTDLKKGAWLINDAGEILLWRLELEAQNPPQGIECYQDARGNWLPTGYYSHTQWWFEYFKVTLSEKGTGRGQVMLSGGQEWHFGKEIDLESTPGAPAIIFDAWGGGGVRNKRKPGTNLPNAFFHDGETALSLLGRIGEDIPHPTQPGKGKFRAFTKSELEQLIVE